VSIHPIINTCQSSRGKKKEKGTNTEIISIDKHIDKMLFRAKILYKGEEITVELEEVN
jgi:hypothetical protein